MAEKTSISGNKLNKISSGSLSFDYIKSNFFRVIHADGIHGGITPNGRSIQLAFFSERQPIPQKETFNIRDGKIENLASKEQRDAIVREVDVEIVLPLETAVVVSKWLEEQIKQAQSLQA